MASIRQLAGCIGLAGNISILADFFGFVRRSDGRPRFPTDPETTAEVRISLLRQARLLQGPHFHLNVTAVGSDSFTGDDRDAIDYSIFKIRNIYNQIGVGVGRVQHYNKESAEANDLDVVTTEVEMETITNTWPVPNNGIDVFVPLIMTVPTKDGGNLLGKSARPGPCEDKDDKGMNGAVVGLFGSEQTARTFAHEVGHYLGLEPDGSPAGHRNDDPNNLMCQSGAAQAGGGTIRDSIELTGGQGTTVKGHCLVKPGC